MLGYLEKLKMKKSLPSVLPKLPKDTFDSKDSGRGRHFQKITSPDAPPAPEPPPAGRTPEYQSMWSRCWELADRWDSHQATAEEIRECQSLLVTMGHLEATGEHLLAPDPSLMPPGEWHTWTAPPAPPMPTSETCPARCRRTGRCYGKTYFTGKPGPFPGPDCDFERCDFRKGQK